MDLGVPEVSFTVDMKSMQTPVKTAGFSDVKKMKPK